MDKRAEIQQRINSGIQARVPSQAWKSTVAIVLAHDNTVWQIGSGTLFQISDQGFVVTAAHVIRPAHEQGKTIGITGSDRLIATPGEWMCSSAKTAAEDEPYDVAVFPLPCDSMGKLESMSFLRVSDVSFDDPGPHAVFTLFGYPGVWSQPSRQASDQLWVEPLEFTTYAYDGDASSFIGYQERLHLLLATGPEYITAPDGSEMTIRDLRGQAVRLPIGLKGISGCSVWHIGDLGVPIERWGDRPARIVGLETGAYQCSGVVRASRWAVVITLIHNAFPSLRPPLKLWLP